eukprot:scaffold5763_cov249-Pinguiococcus_pyrenoidosus.AAC.3
METWTLGGGERTDAKGRHLQRLVQEVGREDKCRRQRSVHPHGRASLHPLIWCSIVHSRMSKVSAPLEDVVETFQRSDLQDRAGSAQLA